MQGPERTPVRAGAYRPRHARFISSGLRTLVLGAALVVTAVALPLGVDLLTSSHAEPEQTYLDAQAVVPVANRPVCSLLGSLKTAAGIVGQDGSHTVEVDGVLYWSFGDTVLDFRPTISNALGWSSESDASDCVTLAPKEVDGRAVPLLPRIVGQELTVWPLGMVATGPGEVSLYYMKVVRDTVNETWKVAGVGIAAFDTGTLDAVRAHEGKLIWTEGGPLPTQPVANGEYIYLFLIMAREAWSTDTILGRVPAAAFDDPGAHEYWEPSGDGGDGHWVSGLWREDDESWQPAVAEIGELWRQPGMHNGVDVAYNEYLGRWTAVYSTSFWTSFNIRTAPALTGPWDEQDVQLMNCLDFHEPGNSPFLCYTGAQHEFYAQDGGRTIYVTYTAGNDYEVYLHELRLGAPVTEWVGGTGGAAYVVGDGEGPDASVATGIAFYASDIPVPGFSAIHRWEYAADGATRYGAASPGAGYADGGVAFYAPADAASAAGTNALYAPVHRWTKDATERYSALDQSDAGFAQQEVAFYAACPDADNDGDTDCAESFMPPAAPSFGEDSDLDGCADATELGPNPMLGGRRDPENFWDFPDMPDSDNVRDRHINIADILRVARRYGTNDLHGRAAITRAADPLSPPPETGYHPAFDRSPAPLDMDPWDTGPPDGRIDIRDLMGVLSQYGHHC